MMNDPQIVYTTTPQNVMKYADFMAKTGAIKTVSYALDFTADGGIHEADGAAGFELLELGA